MRCAPGERTFYRVKVPNPPGIQLPDDDHVKQLLAAVFNHFLKIRSVVRLGGIGTVNVVAQNRDAVLFGKGGAFPNLTSMDSSRWLSEE